MNPLSGLATPAIRKALYAVYGLVVLVLGGIQIAYATDDNPHQPHWLAKALAVSAYVGGALGLTAASNVPTPDTNEPGGDGGFTVVELCVAVIAVIAVLWAFGVLPR